MKLLLVLPLVVTLITHFPHSTWGEQQPTSNLLALLNHRHASTGGAALIPPTTEEKASTDAEDEDIDALVDLHEDEDVDVSSFFRALFDGEDDEEDDEEAESYREGRDVDAADSEVSTLSKLEDEDKVTEKAGENRAVTDEATVTKTNNFVDALFRKVNTELRKAGDPIKLRMNKPKKGAANKFANKRGNKNRNNKKNNKVGNKKANKKAGNKNKNNKKARKGANQKKQGQKRSQGKNKKAGRRPRLLNSETEEDQVGQTDDDEEVEESKVDVEESNDEEAVLSRNKREIDVELVEDPTVDQEEQEEDDETADDEDQDDESSDVEEQEENSRQSKAMDLDSENRGLGMGKRRAQNKNFAGKGKKNKQNKRKGNKGKKKNNNKKKGGNKKKFGGKKRNNKASKKNPTTHAVITGVSTLKRRGNVKITQNARVQRIVADFNVGPVSVELNRKFGGGDKKQARAFTPSLSGKAIIEVNKNGNARIVRMTVLAPKNVRTTGTLARDSSKKRMKAKQDRYLKTTIKRVTPKLTKKIKYAAQRVLTSTSSAVRKSY